MRKHIVFFFLTLIFAISCKHKLENKVENQVKLSFIANPSMGELNVKLDGRKLESETLIIAGKTVSFKAIAKNGYCVDRWKINKEDRYTGQEEIKIKIEKNTNVVLCFKAKPKMCKLTYSFNKDKGSLVAHENENKIESETYIKTGTRVIFKATPNKDFFITSWTLNDEPVNNMKLTYELEIKEDSCIKVNFSKRTKKEIQVEKIVIGKTEYLNKTSSSEKTLELLENGKEEILISEDKIDIKVYIETPKNIKVKLIIGDTVEELEESSNIFEKKEIIMNTDFKTFKLNLSKENYFEKNYSFKIKKVVSQAPSIPENLRIKKFFLSYNSKKPFECIEPSNNGIDYSVEFPANYAGCSFFVRILGEKEDAKFKDKNALGISNTKTNGKDYEIINSAPDKNQSKTFVIVLTYKEEKFEYNLNVHTKGE